ncbi:hypothetical protein BBK_4980 [Burkholderia pseudomallei NCTC 13179]|nr:hypothetical protein BBK_4980 [Burkholderia pseudomallei NCTC 13179]
MKILVAGFRHESNTFAPSKATYASFAADGGRYPLSRGAEIGRLKRMNLPVAGALAALADAGHVALPAVWADATPSGRVESVAFERIAGEIVDAAKRYDADGVYVDLHGAMATERYDDGEGELLRRLRETVGARVPIVASLDLHANVTQRMLDSADGLVTYRTYPHVDMADTGRRAVALLDTLLGRRGRHRHFRSARRVPFLIPVNAMCTSLEPSKSLFRLLERLETGAVRSLSFAPGFPAADFPECGPTIWGYGADPVQLARAVDALYEHVVSTEAQWSVPFMSADDAVTEAIRIARGADKPVVIADTQDNPGAGGGACCARSCGTARPMRRSGCSSIRRPRAPRMRQAAARRSRSRSARTAGCRLPGRFASNRCRTAAAIATARCSRARRSSSARPRACGSATCASSSRRRACR